MVRRKAGDPDVLPVVEERVGVRKTSEMTGAVRVSRTVHEEQRPVSAELSHEDVSVERVPCDRFVEGPIPDRQEGDTRIVSVVEEVPVVVMRHKLVEQIRITRHRRTESWEGTVPVRRSEVTVERLDPPEADEPT